MLLSSSSVTAFGTIEQIVQAGPASDLDVEAGLDHGITHVLQLADQRHVLGAVVVLKPVDVVQQHEVLGLCAHAAIVAVAAVVAHARPAEELANIADLFARQLVRAVDLTLDCC